MPNLYTLIYNSSIHKKISSSEELAIEIPKVSKEAVIAEFLLKIK